MDVADVWAADGVITRAIGDELRRARHSLGWTRSQLVERMPTDIHIRTIAAYEQGERQCAVVRLIEICLALGVAPTDVLGLALQRAEIDLQTVDLLVDLHAVVHDERAELGSLRGWARKRLRSDPDGTGIARLTYAGIQEMAVLLDYDQSELTRHLLNFAPQSAPLA